MSRPAVSAYAEELYSSLGPWHERAEEWGAQTDEWTLLDLCEAVVTVTGFADLLAIVRDTDDGPGWSYVLDIDRAPGDWLGWLGQMVGVRLRAGLAELEQRNRVRSTDGQHRGKASAFRAAAKQYLTGTKYVILNERLGGNAWQVGVRSLVSETPDTTQVLNALLEQKPAGIVLSYDTVPGQTYDAIATAYDSYTLLHAAYATYSAIEANLPI